MKPEHPKSRPAPLPSREEVLEFVKNAGDKVGKREIARAFGIKGDARMELKKLLREMKDDGLIGKARGRRLAAPGSLPEVALLLVTGTDADGEVLARPENWNHEEWGAPPVIYMAPGRHGEHAPGQGDRVLARLRPMEDGAFEAKTIRLIAAAPALVLGVYQEKDGQARIRPTDRKQRSELLVRREDAAGARHGDLVRAEILPGRRLGLRSARVIESLHRPDETSAKTASMIAIHQHGIPTEFSDDAIREAEKTGPAPIDGREDLRDLPLVTIDGEDARDFDDAVWAETDGDGWHLIVAIADVSWYVRPGTSLDYDAKERGNSVYFPDRCVPMLPEVLSNGWCSLRPHEDRPCLVAHMWIDADGNLLNHRFVRAVMRSSARLTYSRIQTARDGAPDGEIEPLMDKVVEPLYGAYAALAKARRKRGVLELDMPERQVVLDDQGNVTQVVERARYDSHKLVEEFMILANVAAAETLESRHQPCMYRVHDSPSLDKMEMLRQFLESLDIKLAKGVIPKSSHLNRILDRVKGTPYAHMVNEVVLRSQAQAEYSPKNIGHFGLALERYCHFTSPIRRYSDLLVHRALVRGLKMGEGGLDKHHEDFVETGRHLSNTERRAAAAERDAVARFTAAFLADKVGLTFGGRITGVTRFGLFVTLDDIGGDGLIPIRSLPDDYYIHDEARHSLCGRSNRLEFRLGENVRVRLLEAEPISGGMLLELTDIPKVAGSGSRKPSRRFGRR